MTMIWENKLIGTESTRRKACNRMHNGRWHERICNFCATQEKPLFRNNFSVKKDRPGKEFRRNDKFFREQTGHAKFVKRRKLQ
ncbi:hypothetical protein ACS0TY_000808 [Phlomoides rotata]